MVLSIPQDYSGKEINVKVTMTFDLDEEGPYISREFILEIDVDYRDFYFKDELQDYTFVIGEANQSYKLNEITNVKDKGYKLVFQYGEEILSLNGTEITSLEEFLAMADIDGCWYFDEEDEAFKKKKSPDFFLQDE